MVIRRNANQYQQETLIRATITQDLEMYNIKSITTSELLENICGIGSPRQNQLNEAGALLRELGYQRYEYQLKLGKKCRTLWVHSQRTVEYDPSCHF